MAQESPSKSKATTGGFKLTSFVLLAIALTVLIVVSTRHFVFRQTPYTKAVALIKAGKAPSALPILEDLEAHHPENVHIFPWLALGYLECERVAEGRIALDTALRMGLPPSEVTDAVNAYAKFYQNKGDFEEAEKLLASVGSNCPALKLNESKAKLYLKWSDTELANNNFEKAIALLETANKLELQEPLGSTVPERLAQVYKEQSAICETSKDDNKAITWLEKSLQIINDSPTRMYLAQLYVRTDQTQKAIENYQIIADADINNLEARHHLIDLLIQSGNYTQAQEALADLINKEKSVENYQQLVEVSLQLKNYARAVHALEDACELGVKADLLKQLLAVLNDWEEALIKEQKFAASASVKGHAERVAEQLNEVLIEEAKNQDKLAENEDKFASAKDLPVALISSRIWLSAGSLTPEGEIKIKNITGKSIRDLTLTAIFYDRTLGHNNGTVILPVVTPNSIPFSANSSRTLYFSCPNTVRVEHRLGVKLFWKGNFLKEFPVAKQS